MHAGCVKCEENYQNVGGFCVANFTQNFCSVENCQWCSAPNYCGQCISGYTVFHNTGGICLKDYSPIPECAIIGVNQYDCAVCNPGYTLNSDLQECIPVATEISCVIPGCIKCYSNNSCETCAPNMQAKENILGHYTCHTTVNPCDVPNC